MRTKVGNSGLATWKTGERDGARTRDLRRDRPAPMSETTLVSKVIPNGRSRNPLFSTSGTEKVGKDRGKFSDTVEREVALLAESPAWAGLSARTRLEYEPLLAALRAQFGEYPRNALMECLSRIPARRERDRSGLVSLFKKRDKPHGYIYFVEAIGTGRVKIGRTVDVDARIMAMRTDCPVGLKLLLSVIANPQLERKLHGALDQYRVHGEWFELNDDVRATMDRIATHAENSGHVRVGKPLACG